MPDLPVELLSLILRCLPALGARCAACVCKSWRSLVAHMDTSLMLVTEGGTNELVLIGANGLVQQRLKALPPLKRKRSVFHARSNSRRSGSQWPTAMALTSRGDAVVSQYKVNGLLLFRRNPNGFHYQRTIVSRDPLSSPEGVVCVNESLYLASVDAGTITRLSLDGTVLDQTEECIVDDHFYVLWGMCEYDMHRSNQHSILSSSAADNALALCCTGRARGCQVKLHRICMWQPMSRKKVLRRMRSRRGCRLAPSLQYRSMGKAACSEVASSSTAFADLLASLRSTDRATRRCASMASST